MLRSLALYTSLLLAANAAAGGAVDWQAARDSVVGRMCTATLINDIEVY